jgi:hypothetical protein
VLEVALARLAAPELVPELQEEWRQLGLGLPRPPGALEGGGRLRSHARPHLTPDVEQGDPEEDGDGEPHHERLRRRAA